MQLTSLADLLDVQDLDLQIDRLLDQRQSLPELDAYKAADEKITDLGNRHDVAAGELRQLELDFDKSEGELEILETKLTEHETRLFAGSMSARETEYMRLEVESLKGQRDAKEDRVLGMLESVDPARQTVADLDASIDSTTAEKSKLEGVIKAEWNKIDAELARKEERKKDALIPVPDDLVETYEKLRQMKEGVAIGRLENGVCGGCHMTLSATEQAEALDVDLPRCVHCRRILVF